MYWSGYGRSAGASPSLWAARIGHAGSRSAARPISMASAYSARRIFSACFGLVINPTAVVGTPAWARTWAANGT